MYETKAHSKTNQPIPNWSLDEPPNRYKYRISLNYLMLEPLGQSKSFSQPKRPGIGKVRSPNPINNQIFEPLLDLFITWPPKTQKWVLQSNWLVKFINMITLTQMIKLNRMMTPKPLITFYNRISNWSQKNNLIYLKQSFISKYHFQSNWTLKLSKYSKAWNKFRVYLTGSQFGSPLIMKTPNS
jgi:hypothetical protein